MPPPSYMRNTPTVCSGDLSWMRELLQSPLLQNFASQFPKADARNYVKIFYNVIFGVSFTNMGQVIPIGKRHLDRTGYSGLYHTAWWATYHGALPMVLKYFLPIILD